MTILVQQLRAEIEQLKAENSSLRDALADKVVDSTKLRAFLPADGGFTIGLEGGPCALLADAFGEQLCTSEAINYLQLTFTSGAYPDLGEIVVTLQRCTGKTPHELRIDAERERDRWQQNYEHLIEHHMPRTGHGCEEGWSRVVEARELKAENTELKAALVGLFDEYKAGADSGDWGHWRVEETEAGQVALKSINRLIRQEPQA